MSKPSKEKGKIASVAVIGGGLGGLATAARLAYAGLEVVLLEKNATTGGKAGIHEEAGFSWDTGPSLLTMPHVLRNVWDECGRPFPLELTRLETTCRYHWRDGHTIDENEAFWKSGPVARFLRRGESAYAISSGAFLNSAPDELWRQFLSPEKLALLRHLPAIASTKTLDQAVRASMDDPHLIQLFNRFATYNGSSPYETPAAFSIIPYIQAHFGGWYVQGGMRKIAVELEKLALDLGVEIRRGVEVNEVQRMRVKGPLLYKIATSGGGIATNFIVSNQDAIRARETIFRGQLPPVTSRSKEPSISAFVMLLGVKGRDPRLAHHNILFSGDYPGEFQAMFREGRPADDPTIYICTSCRTDPARAPADGDNWFVLVNAPALGTGVDWTNQRDDYGAMILRRIGTALGITDLEERVLVRKIVTPQDFAERDLSWRGSLYGFASHGTLSAFQRPPLHDPRMPGVYFVGGTTHPGGGIPLVLLGARIVARKILRKLDLPAPEGDVPEPAS